MTLLPKPHYTRGGQRREYQMAARAREAGLVPAWKSVRQLVYEDARRPSSAYYRNVTNVLKQARLAHERIEVERQRAEAEKRRPRFSKKDVRAVSPQGRAAKVLVKLGLRSKESYWDVGDS